MKKFLVLDTETCGEINVGDSFCYDIGFIVGDYDGNIYETGSYAIADFFLNSEDMSTAFFKTKIPQYWEDIKNGKRKLRRLATVRHIIYDIVKQYDITEMYAFNVRFDYTALLNSQRLATSSKYRYFLPFGVLPFDIMAYARELAKTDEYKSFCIEHNYLTKNKCPQVKAEVVARFLFDENFDEEHQGLDDCKIEHRILCELIKRYPEIDCRLWKD